tara:strand:+ start:338 stop:589 length:252 start_codon:yes stop_codon:yes gene_type:complete
MYSTRHKVVIYSRDLCGYCDMAKNWFETKDLAYTEHKIGADGFTREMLLEAVPNAKTVPQIFVDDELIGGWTDLINHKFYTEA